MRPDEARSTRKAGMAFSGEPKRAAERTCRRRVGWLPRSYARETITKLNEDIKEGWPLSGECEQNARLFCERCSTRRSGTPPAERPPSGWRATRTSRTTAASSPVPAPSSSSATHARPVRFPLAAHQRLSATRESLFGAPSGAESLAELVNLLAPIRTGLRVPGSGHPLVATAGAPPRRRPEPRAR